MFVLGWLLFSPRRQWSLRLAPLAFVWPVAWLVYTFVRGAIAQWYPYPFLDAQIVGLTGALTGAGIVIVYAAGLTLVVLAVDRWVPSLATPSVRRIPG